MRCCALVNPLNTSLTHTNASISFKTLRIKIIFVEKFYSRDISRVIAYDFVGLYVIQGRNWIILTDAVNLSIKNFILEDAMQLVFGVYYFVAGNVFQLFSYYLSSQFYSRLSCHPMMWNFFSPRVWVAWKGIFFTLKVLFESCR